MSVDNYLKLWFVTVFLLNTSDCLGDSRPSLGVNMMSSVSVRQVVADEIQRVRDLAADATGMYSDYVKQTPAIECFLKSNMPKAGLSVVALDSAGSYSKSEGLIGDVILAVDGKFVGNEELFNNWFKIAKSGVVYEFEIRRFDERISRWRPQTLNVKLEQSVQPKAEVKPKEKTKLSGFDTGSNLHYSFDVAGGTLSVFVDCSVIYLPSDGDDTYFSFIRHRFTDASGNEQRDVEGFYSIDGKASRIKIDSDNKDILRVRKHPSLGTELTFTKEGKVNLTIELGENTFHIPMSVIRINLEIGDRGAAVVERLGIPDQSETIFTSWPDVETHDNIIYAPEAGRVILAKHLKYARHPNLVVSIVDSAVYRIRGCYDPKPEPVLEEEQKKLIEELGYSDDELESLGLIKVSEPTKIEKIEDVYERIDSEKSFAR